MSVLHDLTAQRATGQQVVPRFPAAWLLAPLIPLTRLCCPPHALAPGPVVGLDIGCGANLIYPLLGAKLCGWRMVGADVSPAALQWAALNLGANPQLGCLIELRRVEMQPEQARFHAGKGAGPGGEAGSASGGKGDGGGSDSGVAARHGADGATAAAAAGAAGEAAAHYGSEGTGMGMGDAAEQAPAVAAAAPALVARLLPAEATGSGIISSAVRHGERFAFCMCNPPFFERDEAKQVRDLTSGSRFHDCRQIIRFIAEVSPPQRAFAVESHEG